MLSINKALQWVRPIPPFLFPDITNLPWIEDVYLGIYWMAMATTLVNPMVYYCINTKFRQYFQKIFCCGYYSNESI